MPVSGPDRSCESNMIEFKAIGIIHTPFIRSEGTPIQPRYADGACGTVELFAEYEAGLKDLDGFSHIFLLYHFHRSQGFNLELVPFMDTQSRGSLPPVRPRGRMPSAFPWLRWKGSKVGCFISRTWTFWTAHRYSTSSPTCRSLTVAPVSGSDGLRRPEKPL